MSVKETKQLLRRMEELYSKFNQESNEKRKESLRKLFLSTAQNFKRELKKL